MALHPNGIADGIMLYHAISESRPDQSFNTNSDILRVLPQSKQMITCLE